jgi:hypothetical protein
MTTRPAAPPPLVTVTAVLLYLGAGLIMMYGLFEFGGLGGGTTSLLPGWGELLYGAFYLGLARGLQVGVRWARRVMLALCGIGLGLAPVYAIWIGPQAGAEQAVWPVVFLVLLTRPSVRAWYAPS